MWNGINPEIPRQLICRNLGFARFSAPRALRTSTKPSRPSLRAAQNSRLFHSRRPPRSYAKAAKVSLDGLCPLRFVGGSLRRGGAERGGLSYSDAVTPCVSGVSGQRSDPRPASSV